MFPEAIKKVLKSTIVVGILAPMIMVSCDTKNDSKAQDLYSRAEQAFKQGQLQQSLNMLKELDSVYHDNVAIRKKAMHLRPQIIEKQVIGELNATDSMIAINKWICDSLSKELKRVNNAIESYYVTSNSPSDINSAPGIYGRMSPEAMLYLIAVSPGCRANAISISSGNETFTSNALPYDDERCVTYGSNNVMTFLHGEIPDIVEYFAKTTDNGFQINFLNGGNIVKSLSVDSHALKQLKAICNLALTIKQTKLLELEKNKLDKQLIVARNQIARTMQDDNNQQ